MGLSFSSKLKWGSYIISIIKTVSKQSRDLFYEISFSWDYMEYCFHVWAGTPSCCLEMIDKLQNRICGSISLSVAASLEPLAHWWNVASLSLFSRYYFSRYSSEQLVPRPYSRETSTCYSDRLHDFPVIIPRVYNYVYINSFFPRTARLWNSLPIECFPLTPMI